MNLLEETKLNLEDNEKSIEDVKWVGSKDGSLAIDWGEFEKISNFNYDDGYGSPEIPLDFVIVGKDWWLERYEYDGAESWEFKQLPLLHPNARYFSKIKPQNYHPYNLLEASNTEAKNE